MLNTKRVFFIVDKIIEKRVSITNVSVKVVSKTIVKITKCDSSSTSFKWLKRANSKISWSFRYGMSARFKLQAIVAKSVFNQVAFDWEIQI